MSGKELRLPDYLGHIVEAIDRIEEHVGDMDKASFRASKLVTDAVIRNIEVIGEASNKVRKHHRSFADANPQVPWKESYEMRSVVAHDYFKVDLDLVWATIKGDLPGLREEVRRLLNELVQSPNAGNRPSGP
jgi:uncharacterized protein with HEPN domain